jgi:hypothetical protein
MTFLRCGAIPAISVKIQAILRGGNAIKQARLFLPPAPPARTLTLAEPSLTPVAEAGARDAGRLPLVHRQGRPPRRAGRERLRTDQSADLHPPGRQRRALNQEEGDFILSKYT